MTSNFDRFEYQCRLSGMNFNDFCRLSDISESAATYLLESKGGRKYLISELGKVREETITVGDVLQVLIVHGIQCGFDGCFVEMCSDGVTTFFEVSHDYQERQEQLGNILLGVEK